MPKESEKEEKNMRMRKRQNLKPRMERSAAARIADPKAYLGDWRSLKPDAKELCLEIGCGKGRFTIETAKANPDMLLIAVEKVEDCLILAMEAALREELKNVYFIACDAVELPDIFAQGEVDRIYLNFSDPWPRKKNAKRRLTYHSFLERYAWVLSEKGRLEFKSDNVGLFDFSLEEFPTYGWQLSEITRNLHENGPVGIMTDYEARFYEEGKPIQRLVAVPTVRPKEKPIRLDRFPVKEPEGEEKAEEA